MVAVYKPSILRPTRFSIDNLISIAQTRLDALADHLWLLQTEPAYIRRYIRLLCQVEFYRTVDKDAAGALLSTQLFNDMSTYWRWVWIKSEFMYVKGVHDRFRGSNFSGRMPPFCLRQDIRCAGAPSRKWGASPG